MIRERHLEVFRVYYSRSETITLKQLRRELLELNVDDPKVVPSYRTIRRAFKLHATARTTVPTLFLTEGQLIARRDHADRLVCDPLLYTIMIFSDEKVFTLEAPVQKLHG